MVAQKELEVTEVENKTVDNLVLIGSPINNSLLQRPNKNKNIKKLHIINLDKQGDPIYAGMSDFEIILSTKKLLDQIDMNTRHFYYIDKSKLGAQRRNELARDLKKRELR